MNENLNKAIQKMQDLGKDIKEYGESKYNELDDSTKEKISLLINKTTDVINNTIDKVKEAAQNVDDDGKLNEFLEKVVAKCSDAVEFAKTKINELLPNNKSFDDIEKDITNSFKSFFENDNVKTVVDRFKAIGDSVNDYLNKPEVKAKINKAKKTSLEVAEKGMNRLRVILATDDEEEPQEIEQKEEPKED